MLTCYSGTVQLPQNDLAYAAFRIAAVHTLVAAEACEDAEEDFDGSGGFLSAVPFLAQVPEPVQVDLLAEVWARHDASELHEANLLEAAVVYAACMTAGDVVAVTPDVARAYLKAGPRRVGLRLTRKTPERLADLFDEFWDDEDFLMLDDWQDLAPDHAEAVRAMLRLADEDVRPMYEALARGKVSRGVASNLGGLLTAEEVRQWVGVLK
jgi:hypothetical protein